MFEGMKFQVGKEITLNYFVIHKSLMMSNVLDIKQFSIFIAFPRQINSIQTAILQVNCKPHFLLLKVPRDFPAQ